MPTLIPKIQRSPRIFNLNYSAQGCMSTKILFSPLSLLLPMLCKKTGTLILTVRVKLLPTNAKSFLQYLIVIRVLTLLRAFIPINPSPSYILFDGFSVQIRSIRHHVQLFSWWIRTGRITSFHASLEK
jgi:hypothetical protein